MAAGFTSTELSVVGPIIAFLIAILLPSLRGARSGEAGVVFLDTHVERPAPRGFLNLRWGGSLERRPTDWLLQRRLVSVSEFARGAERIA